MTLTDWALISGSSFTPSKDAAKILAAVSGKSKSAAIRAAQSAHFFTVTRKQFFSSKENLFLSIFTCSVLFSEVIKEALARAKNHYCSQYLKESMGIWTSEYFCLATVETVFNVHALAQRILTAVLIVVEDKVHDVNRDGWTVIRFKAWGYGL